MTESLTGCKIQRVDGPNPDVIALTLYCRGSRRVLLIGLSGDRVRWGLATERPRGQPADPRIRQLRRRLVGAVIVEAVESRLGWELRVRRGDESLRFGTVVSPPSVWLIGGQRVLYCDQPNRSLGIRPGGIVTAAPQSDPEREVDIDRLREAGSSFLDDQANSTRAAQQTQLLRAIAKRLKRFRRRRAAVSGDLARLAQVPEYRNRASLILANLWQLPAKTDAVEVLDFEGQLVRIAIEPGRSPKQHAEWLYGHAKRLERGAEIARARLLQTDQIIETLERARKELESSHGEAVDAVAERLAPLLAQTPTRRSKNRKTRSGKETRLPYREFSARDGTPIWVGRSATDNDALTLRYCRPHDHWLHARSVRGAHVVVRVSKGATPPYSPETLLDAATLAAHFSEARGDHLVEVQHTPRRFVHKRRGSAPGAVTLTQERVIGVRLERARLERLLQSEGGKL